MLLKLQGLGVQELPCTFRLSHRVLTACGAHVLLCTREQVHAAEMVSKLPWGRETRMMSQVWRGTPQRNLSIAEPSSPLELPAQRFNLSTRRGSSPSDLVILIDEFWVGQRASSVYISTTLLDRSISICEHGSVSCPAADYDPAIYLLDGIAGWYLEQPWVRFFPLEICD